MVYSSGIKMLVVTLTMVGGGHDQWIEGRYLSGQCNREAMALAMRFKVGEHPNAKKIEIDCLREDEYERRQNEWHRSGHRKESSSVYGKTERRDSRYSAYQQGRTPVEEEARAKGKNGPLDRFRKARRHAQIALYEKGSTILHLYP